MTDEFETIAASERNNGDAWMLHCRLRLDRFADIDRGGTLIIAAKAMSEAGTIPGWTRGLLRTSWPPNCNCDSTAARRFAMPTACNSVAGRLVRQARSSCAASRR